MLGLFSKQEFMRRFVESLRSTMAAAEFTGLGSRSTQPKWAKPGYFRTVGQTQRLGRTRPYTTKIQTFENPTKLYQSNGKREVARRLRQAARRIAA